MVSSVGPLYEKLEAPLIRTDLATAEMIKYVDNSWHALKIGFANEIGNLCKATALDAHEVIEDFLSGSKAEHFACLSYARVCIRRLGAYQRIFGLCLIRPNCMICSCLFSTRFSPATRYRLVGACS